MGDDGVLLYDTGVGAESGALVAEEIRKVTDKPVVAICAVRTGSGKSQTTRRISEILKSMGRTRSG